MTILEVIVLVVVIVMCNQIQTQIAEISMELQTQIAEISMELQRIKEELKNKKQ